MLLAGGDDCAIVSPDENKQLVITTDTLVSGVHFPEKTSAEDIAYKALMVNLSDLANRLLETIQPLLGQAGSVVGSLATGAAASIGKIFFIVFVAYFILSESQRVGEITFDQIP